MGAILRITEGSLAPVACLEQEHVDCPRMADCRTLPMWRKLNTMIQDFFRRHYPGRPDGHGSGGERLRYLILKGSSW